MTLSPPPQCPDPDGLPCGHTDAEHRAFDAGFADAENDRPSTPTGTYAEQEAYLTGYSAGSCTV